MDRILLRYPGINADGEDNANLYNMRNHGGIHHVDDLVDYIKYASQSYYDGNPKVPDSIFNQALALLHLNDPDHPLLTQPGYGYELDEEKVKFFGAFSHDPPMTTIPLSHRFELSAVLASKTEVISGNFIVMPKYNGSSGRAYYRDGLEQTVLTRGNGNEGLDVKDNLILGRSIPYMVQDRSLSTVDGEFVIRRSDWTSHFKGADDPIEARNRVTRISEGVDNDVRDEMRLKFIAYGSNEPFRMGYEIDALVNLGFSVAAYKRCHNWKDLTDFLADEEQVKKFCGDYFTDGFILRNKDAVFALKT